MGNMGMAFSEMAEKYERMDKRASTEGGNMAESIDFNEEKATNTGGSELEEVDEREKSAAEQKAKDPSTLANPTELQGGNAGGSDSPGLPGGDSAAAE